MRKVKSVALWFLEPRAILPFLIGTVSIGVLSNATWEILLDALGREPWAVFGVVLLALVAFGLATLWFRSASEKKVGLNAREYPAPPKKRGCIVLVSRTDAAKAGLKHHLGKLEKCWLIHSCQPQSQQSAEDIKTWLNQEDDKVVAETRIVEDANDPLEVRNVVDAIYASLPPGMQPNDVISDYTGMTANASVGMVLACLDPDRELQYVSQEYKPDGTPTGRSLQPRAITLSWEYLSDSDRRR